MKRREFVEKVGMGSAALITGGVLGKSDKMKGKASPQQGQGHEHAHVSGERAGAVVAFGQWKPFDRIGNAAGPNDRTQNNHVLTPFRVRIKAGGAVSFIISGFHNPVIYGNGKQLEDVNVGLILPGSTPPGLIDDPDRRVFRGINPATLPVQDRIENVTLPDPGEYLVICAVVPHFVNDKMHGFIIVEKPDDDDDDKKGKGK
jgi:plastocyanin